MKKILLIGTGTGRCGTTSLANLCKLQDGVDSTHEALGSRMKWIATDEERWNLIDTFCNARFKDSDKVVDVSVGWIAYLPVLKRYCELNDITLKVVGLVRGREAYVESSRKHAAGTNSWLTWTPESKYKKCGYNWGQVFPKWDSWAHMGKDMLAGRWWDLCLHILIRYRGEFDMRVISTDMLNDEQSMDSVLRRWLELDELKFNAIRANVNSREHLNVPTAQLPPPTEGVRIALVTIVEHYRIDLIRAFVKHYSKWCDLSDMHVIVQIPDPDTEWHEMGIALHSMGVQVSLWEGEYSAKGHIQKNSAKTQEVCNFDGWHFNVDSDEFFDPGVDVKKLVSNCNKNGRLMVKSKMTDRIAADGSLVKLQPGADPFETYPVEVDITNGIMVGHPVKFCLLANPYFGHHTADGCTHKPNVALETRKLFHFKWDETVIPRLKKRVRDYKKQGDPYWKESDRFLRHLKANDGKVNAKPTSEEPPKPKLSVHERGFWINPTTEDHTISVPLANAMVRMMTDFGTETILDMGCGDGSYMKVFEDVTPNVTGIDGSPTVTQLAGEKAYTVDLSNVMAVKSPYDAVVCLEVGEHIPKKYEEVFLDNIRHATKGLVIMSWAIPGQNGRGHVNEQPNKYIIDKMIERGFTYCPGLSQVLRSSIDNVAPYFRNTLMVFRLDPSPPQE